MKEEKRESPSTWRLTGEGFVKVPLSHGFFSLVLCCACKLLMPRQNHAIGYSGFGRAVDVATLGTPRGR